MNRNIIWFYLAAMQRQFAKLIHNSQNIGIQISDLYLQFYNLFPEDAELWWELSITELNHVCLLGDIKDFVSKTFSSAHIKKLETLNYSVYSLIKKHNVLPPTRSQALSVALHLERSLNKLYSQKAFQSTSTLDFYTVFKQLCTDTNTHSETIISYAKENTIFIESNAQTQRKSLHV